MTSGLYRLTNHHIYTIHLCVEMNAILRPTQLGKNRKKPQNVKQWILGIAQGCHLAMDSSQRRPGSDKNRLWLQ